MKAIYGFGLLFLASFTWADCSTEQTLCETQCAVVHFTDEAAELGCKSKCVAKRALCSTESGAKTAVDAGGEVIDSGVEVSKDAWQDTKSFVKGLTE
ncbi:MULTISPECIES: hypothetical protein [unclassified Neptuniibacter]|jgi:hypothetical protein|uniref:hypothetical protein n=1 Tax=unclassified Neptuniibacter TaxID=2630693 RepID=UPI0026E1320C|nr:MULTISPECIES: hypothetical protein [unclassified Neptuniibacter]MDO6514190.1 hypothetical protein [Neptuniibacter sp. 2_MG-2023]MDO6592687.1 hypothetical protein [Neptuniibacter sp. 1_MG-2023]